MKSLSVKLGVILIGLLILGNAEVWGADWKVFDEEIISFEESDPNSKGKSEYKRLNYYDRESITRPSKGIVKIWSKFVDQRETLSHEKAIEYVHKEYEKWMKNQKYKDEKEKNMVGQLWMVTKGDKKIHQYSFKYGLILYQFNCLERTYRELESGYYDKEGTFLSGYGDRKSTFEIEPESQIEKLHKKVCK